MDDVANISDRDYVHRLFEELNYFEEVRPCHPSFSCVFVYMSSRLHVPHGSGVIAIVKLQTTLVDTLNEHHVGSPVSEVGQQQGPPSCRTTRSSGR